MFKNYTNLEVQPFTPLQHNELKNVVIRGQQGKQPYSRQHYYNQQQHFRKQLLQQHQKPYSKPWQWKKAWKKRDEGKGG